MTSKKYKDSYNSFISFYLVYQVFIGRNQSGLGHRTFHSKKQNSYPKGAAALKPALFQPLDDSSCLGKL